MNTPRGPNSQLRALLTEAGWTQDGLARAVNTVGSEIGDQLRYDRSAVAHWLTGTEPRPPVPQLIAEALTRRIGRTVTPRDAGFRPDALSEATEGPVDPVAGLAAPHGAGGCTVRVPPQHRPYRTADTHVPPAPNPPAPEPPVPHAAANSPEAAAELPGTHAAAPARPAADLEASVRHFAREIDAHGGLHAHPTLTRYLTDEVAPLLRSAPSRQRGPLLVSASRLCLLLGRMYADGLRQGAAQQYYTYAHQLAAEAGDQDAWATALRMMSAQAQHLGHTLPGLRLAEAAAEATRTSTPPRRAYMQVQLAVMQAESGERRAALATLATAERAASGAGTAESGTHSGGGTSGQHGPFDAYPLAALAFQRSLVLEALGDIPGAVSALRRSRARREATDVRGLALSEARLGRVLLRAGRLDEACHAWRGFLDQHRELSSGEAKRELYEIRRALLPYRSHRPAAQLLEQARPYTR